MEGAVLLVHETPSSGRCGRCTPRRSLLGSTSWCLHLEPVGEWACLGGRTRWSI